MRPRRRFLVATLSLSVNDDGFRFELAQTNVRVAGLWWREAAAKDKD